jgi:hypothetical protein
MFLGSSFDINAMYSLKFTADYQADFQSLVVQAAQMKVTGPLGVEGVKFGGGMGVDSSSAETSFIGKASSANGNEGGNTLLDGGMGNGGSPGGDILIGTVNSNNVTLKSIDGDVDILASDGDVDILSSVGEINISTPEDALNITSSGVHITSIDPLPINMHSKLNLNAHSMSGVTNFGLEETSDHSGSLSAGNTALYVNTSKALMYKTVEDGTASGNRILTKMEQDTFPKLGGNLDLNGKALSSISDFAISLNGNTTAPINTTFTLRSQNQGSGKGIIDLACDRITGSVIDTDDTFASSTDTNLASQLAIKTYVDRQQTHLITGGARYYNQRQTN